MPKVSKATVDAALRTAVFADLIPTPAEDEEPKFVKINDRQYGVLLTDLNGTERYVRIGAIVAEERTDKTARELMDEEITQYRNTQAEKARKAAERKAKAEADKARREAKEEEVE